MKLQPIERASSSDLEPYATLRRSQLHLRQGLFIAEGTRVVEQLLGSSVRVVSLLVTPPVLDRLGAKLESALPGETAVWVVAGKSAIERRVGMGINQGVLALGRIPEELPLPQHVRQLAGPVYAVALDGVDHAVNIGSIVRTAAAFGVNTIIASGPLSHPYLRRAIRASTGAVFRVSVFASQPIGEVLRTLRDDFGTTLLAAEPSGRQTINDLRLSGNNRCIVFGSEHAGISPTVLELHPRIVSVPMLGTTVGSLSVSAAAAVILYSLRPR